MTKIRFRRLDEAELYAVRTFVKQYDRRWREILAYRWRMGHDLPSSLLRLKDSHGPEWLKTYRLPKIVKRVDIKKEKVIHSQKGFTNRYYVQELPAWVFAPEDRGETEASPQVGGPAWWSGTEAPPAIGDQVKVNMNGLGVGTVRAYLVEYGWLGVEVELDRRPEWHLKQNGDEHPWAMVFGVELDLFKEVTK